MASLRPLLLATAASVMLGAAEQRPAPAAGTGLIVGQVIDATTGRAVADAVVTLAFHVPPVPATAQLVDMGIGALPPQNGRRGLTSENGRFLFRDVPPGRYDITATAPSYATAAHGQTRLSGPSQPIDLAAGQKLGGITVAMWKLGTISGVVVDELGEPAVGVPVRYLRRVIAGGKVRFATIAAQGSPTTDDRGVFRIAGLPAGDYAIGVIFNPTTAAMSVVDMSATATEAGNPNTSESYRRLQSSISAVVSATGFRLGDLVLYQPSSGATTLPPPGPGGRLMAYQTTFYPAAPTPSQATLVAVKPGEERGGVNLQLRLVPAVKVSGTVIGPDGPGSFLGMTLVPPTGTDYQSEGVAEAASSVSDANGAFTFLGIPPGEYLMKIRYYPRPTPVPGTATMTSNAGGGTFSPGSGVATPPSLPEPGLWATQPITVGNADLDNVAVVLRRGLTVRGRVQFTGAGPPPPPDQIQRMQITLQWAEGRTSAPLPPVGRAFADRTFASGAYAGNRYIIAAVVPPAGWTLKSAMWNGRDISVEAFELDADIGDVVLTFTDRTTDLTGLITGSKGPDAAAEVIVFPADTLAWKEIGVTTRRSRNVRTDRGGRFGISGLPAGDYFVVAVPGGAIRDWNDPKFLEPLMPSATRITLADGEKKAIDLRTVAIK